MQAEQSKLNFNSKTHTFFRIRGLCETQADTWIKTFSSQAPNCLSCTFICIFSAWVVRTWPCLPQPWTNTGSSYLDFHCPPLCPHTRGKDSGCLESSVMLFVIRIILNNLGSFLFHKNTLTLRIQFGNFNEALQFTFNVYRYTKYKKSHIHINFVVLQANQNEQHKLHLLTQQNGTFSSFIHRNIKYLNNLWTNIILQLLKQQSSIRNKKFMSTDTLTSHSTKWKSQVEHWLNVSRFQQNSHEAIVQNFYQHQICPPFISPMTEKKNHIQKFFKVNKAISFQGYLTLLFFNLFKTKRK